MEYSDSLKEKAKTARCGVYIPKGWIALVNKLDADISKIYPDYVLSQAKEKFGGLRFYLGSTPNSVSDEDFKEINNLISKAEEQSCKTCHECGAPAAMQSNDGWFIPACEKHATK